MQQNPFGTEQIGIQALEKSLIRTKSKRQLQIGVPKETAADEHRIALTPSGVASLTANGHTVTVERDAGVRAQFSDDLYLEAGASIADSPEEVFRDHDVIVKVGPPARQEWEWMARDQTLLSALHLGNAERDLIVALMEKGVAAIGFEFIRGADGEFPIVRMMHEITGSVAVQIASHYLETDRDGQGLMLGGVAGVPGASVVILGAGVTGEFAARAAMTHGARVTVIDNDLAALRRIENALGRQIITATANAHYLVRAVQRADVVIGSAMVEGERASVWMTEEMVEMMRPGGVIVDTVIDQGGCVETSRPTTHSDPVYRVHDVIHYCVPNIPSKVAQTATIALSNVLIPYVLKLGDSGSVRDCLWTHEALRRGTYVYHKHLTKKTLAEHFGMSYRDVELLIASQI